MATSDADHCGQPLVGARISRLIATACGTGIDGHVHMDPAALMASEPSQELWKCGNKTVPSGTDLRPQLILVLLPENALECQELGSHSRKSTNPVCGKCIFARLLELVASS